MQKKPQVNHTERAKHNEIEVEEDKQYKLRLVTIYISNTPGWLVAVRLVNQSAIIFGACSISTPVTQLVSSLSQTSLYSEHRRIRSERSPKIFRTT